MKGTRRVPGYGAEVDENGQKCNNGRAAGHGGSRHGDLTKITHACACSHMCMGGVYFRGRGG